LCHEGVDAEALRGKGIAQAPVDGLGLPGRVTDPGGPGEDEALARHPTPQPTNGGHGVTRLDLPFGMMGVHSGLSFVTTRERARARMMKDSWWGVPELSSAGTSAAKRDVPVAWCVARTWNPARYAGLLAATDQVRRSPDRRNPDRAVECRVRVVREAVGVPGLGHDVRDVRREKRKISVPVRS